MRDDSAGQIRVVWCMLKLPGKGRRHHPRGNVGWEIVTNRGVHSSILEVIKAPQQLLFIPVPDEDAVVDQFTAMRYPHYIEGEEYLALNLPGAENRIVAHSRRISSAGESLWPRLCSLPFPDRRLPGAAPAPNTHHDTHP
jgi:hypothetical protein